MSTKRYKFQVECDTNLVIRRYCYTLYGSEDDGTGWYPIVSQESHMALTKKKAIEHARNEIREMQAIDNNTKTVHEEEVT